jgi:uncharacterized protein YbaA (DUF1428 family)
LSQIQDARVIADRDRCRKKVMAEKRLAKMMDPKKMPFDGKRMI